MGKVRERIGEETLAVAGGVLLLMGGLNMIGWLIPFDRFVHPVEGGVTTSFNAGLAIALFGVGLVAARFKIRWLVFGSGLAMLLIGVGTLVQYMFGTDLGIDEMFVDASRLAPEVFLPGRMSASAAALVALAGTVLMTGAAPEGREAGGVLAWAAGVLFLVSGLFVMLHLPGLEWMGWRGFKAMSLLGGVATAIGGIGLVSLGHAWRGHRPDLRTRRLGALTFLLLAAVGVNLWQALSSADMVRTEAATEQAARSVEWQLTEGRAERYSAYVRLAARYAEGRYGADDWEADATRYLDGIPSIRSLLLVDGDGRILRLVTRHDPDEVPDDTFYTFDAQRAALLDDALTSMQLVISPPMPMRLGGLGFQMVMPFQRPDGPMAMIVGMAYEDVFRSMLQDAVPGYAFDISVAGQVVYDRSYGQSPPTDVPVVRRSLSAPGGAWEVRVWPLPDLALAPHGMLPLGVLLLSLVSALLVAVAFRYSMLARERLRTALDATTRLREEKSVSSAIWSGSRDVLCTTDMDGRFVRVSDAARVVWGYEPSELEGKPYVEIIHPGDRAATLAEAEEILRGKFVGTFVNRTLHRDGRYLYTSWSAQWSKELGMMVSIGRDITRLIERERELAASEERLRVAVERTGRMVYDRRTDSQRSAWVGDPVALLGVTLQELVEMEDAAWWRRVHADDRVRAKAAFAQARDQGGTFRSQYRWKHGNGRWIWLEDAGGVADGRMIGVLSDITVQREVEQQLEERVEVRTRELVDANTELESFSYSVSHDLRTPLRAVAGFTELLKEQYGDALDDTGRHYLKRIETGAGRMGMLIDDLLALGQVSRRDLARETVNLSDMAEAILSRLQESEPTRNVEWRIQPDLEARCDPRLVEVMLDNLLGNAWKFTRDRDPAVIEFDVAEGGFRVADNGVGFDMQHAGQLFGVFQRLHAIHEFPGTGIGLATVRRIVERHGGMVWAYGEKEQGASFFFTFGE